MQKREEITKIKHGRQCTMRLDVKDWRRRMKRFKRLKALIVAELSKLPKEQVQTWLTTPVPELKNRTPKFMINPRRIQVLYNWLQKQPLTSTSIV